MKTNAEVAQAFREGRPAAAGHLHTNGRDIYSYSTMIAQRQDNGTILIASRDYSNTTRRHKSHIFHACKGLAVFEVSQVEKPTRQEHDQNLEELKARAEALTEKASRARKAEWKTVYKRAAKDASKDAYWYSIYFCL